jgi:putative sugar O-methyltransferase
MFSVQAREGPDVASKLTDGDTALLDAMEVDYRAGDALYHPSAFWENLNAINTDWLRRDGPENFKRTVNNNYFNWMVSARSDYFRVVLMHNVRRALRDPLRLGRFLSGRMQDFHCRTMVSEDVHPSFTQRQVYKFYVMLLHQYVLDSDRRGRFGSLEEPLPGNPLAVLSRGRRISQDLSNSYLEFQFLADALGDALNEFGTIAEIGAGYGRLMHVLRVLGVNARLIVIDIPPALFVSQWYLTRIFPDAPVFRHRPFRTYSEIKTEFEQARLCFLLPHQAELLPDRSLDLVINISSLQEMTKAQISGYYDLIHRKARHFYTKQWMRWENPDDGRVASVVGYPVRAEWDVIDFRLNPVHRHFFEAVYHL